VRAVADCLGIKDLLTKCYRSNNAINMVKATFDGLLRVRTRADIEKLRGVKLTPPPRARSGTGAAAAGGTV
jgi:small subunit ribosomal protein S5